MKWLAENWSLLVVAFGCLVVFILYAKKFMNEPTDKQIAKIKEWLLFAVVQAEKELGGGTGALKLRYVYDMFIKAFPALVDLVTFEMFSKLVDEVLEEMKHLLETNMDIAYYVNSED